MDPARFKFVLISAIFDHVRIPRITSRNFSIIVQIEVEAWHFDEPMTQAD
jgi:hypothetical protein